MTDDVKALVEALKPFALVAEHDIGESETDSDLFRPMEGKYARAPRLTVGDLRRARAAPEALSCDRAGEQKVVAEPVEATEKMNNAGFMKMLEVGKREIGQIYAAMRDVAKEVTNK